MNEDWSLHHGDALAWLRVMPGGYADALVTDPPAGIAFMGNGWDRDKGGRTAWVAWLTEILSEARRCLKPGAAGFVWALPRTSHWTGMACEEAGFEVRDVVTHVQGQGFPKSKALLKPAAEHWILVRNPGPLRDLRIDECRVGISTGDLAQMQGRSGKSTPNQVWGPGIGHHGTGTLEPKAAGRWPANFAMSHSEGCESAACEADCPVALLDRQSGITSVTGKRSERSRNAMVSGTTWGTNNHRSTEYTDSGSASRFFHTIEADPFIYQAKATKSDRTASGTVENKHPTVKSVALMRLLCRLVTPAEGLVLDPFSGSGTTGVAALLEGLRFAGAEKEEEYIEIARRRLSAEDGRP